MSLVVGDAVNKIFQKLNLIGQQVDQSDVFMYLEDTIEYFTTTYAFPNAKKFMNMTFFAGVRQYKITVDDFGTLGEPERPPALYSPTFQHSTERELSHWPYGNQIGLEYADEDPYIVANLNHVDSATYQYLLESCDDTTNLTSISGDGSNAVSDKVLYTQGEGSIRFSVTASTGQISLIFSLPSFDISDFLDKCFAFLDLSTPSTNTNNLTSVVLRIGNDASNYYYVTATEYFRGQALSGGQFTTVGFDLRNRQETGTVDDTAIDWIQVLINIPLTGVNGDYHIDNIFLSQGISFQVPYYSIYNILAEGTTPTDSITSLDDVILIPRSTQNAVVFKTLEYIAASPNVNNTGFANYCARELVSKEALLRSLYPVQRMNTQSVWYKRSNFRRGIRRSS